MAAEQFVGDQPDQREHNKREALHHHMQADVLEAVADLLAGQVDPVQEKHQKHTDVDHPFSVHGAAGLYNIDEVDRLIAALVEIRKEIE